MSALTERPGDSLELALTEIWRDVLAAPQLHADSDFFHAGGHSLSAFDIVAQVAHRLGRPLGIEDVFLHPTPRQLAARLAERASGPPLAAPVARAAECADYPLGHAQAGLWALHQRWPGSQRAYNVPGAYRLRGPLDVTRLERALNGVVQRHESLRTVFFDSEQGPRMRVLPPRRVPLQRSAAGDDLDQTLVDLASQPLDLGRQPLQAHLLCLGDEDHLLQLTLHHLVADGASVPLLMNDLLALYAAGNTSPLPVLPLRYRDYVLWQADWLNSPAAAAARDHWRQALTPVPPRLDLAPGLPRPATRDFAGHTQVAHVDAHTLATLGALVQAEQASLFMGLTALVKALLHRLTGEFDISVGTPVAGREHPDLAGIAGLFVNTLVLRDHLVPGMTFRQLLGAVRDTSLLAFNHGRYPFDQVVAELDTAREPGRTSLFDVMVILQSPGAALSTADLAISDHPFGFPVAKFDLSFEFRPLADGGLEMALPCRGALFSPARTQALAEQALVLLRAALEQPDAPLQDLPLLSLAQQQALLERFNPDYRPPAGTTTLLARLGHWAREQAQAIAVSGEDGMLTYADLEQRANGLAALLGAAGVGPGTRVLMLLERGCDLVVGMLGVLKSGAAYVPLDPGNPDARLLAIAADCGGLVLTQAGLANRAATLGLPLLHLEAAVPSAHCACPPATPDSTAYVIFTSGSSGTPKGVCVSHANLQALLETGEQRFGFDNQDVWTLFHSTAFDFSVWEIWGALFSGGRLVVVPTAIARTTDAFRRLLAEQRVTVLNQTPSAFLQLIAADARDSSPLALRWILLGGEALEPRSLLPWFERHGDCRPRLVNLYGITETTVHVTARALSHADARDGSGSGSGSPIGHPLPHMRLYLLDPQRRQVPAGVIGELHVGGAGVAQGYLARPQLTAERFSDDPFSREPGARLYRSGDLGVATVEGEILYLGRADEQLKIRGYRIEPAEAARQLLEHPALEACAVAGWRRPDADLALAAWFVSNRPTPPSAAELRSHLAGRLPDYLIPLAYVAVARLPLTSNGKLDHAALPAPVLAAAEDSLQAPLNPLQRQIAAIWSEVLARPSIGLDEDFFAIGGHSLMATQVVARVRAQFALEIPLAALFEYPSLRQFSQLIVDRLAPPAVTA